MFNILLETCTSVLREDNSASATTFAHAIILVQIIYQRYARQDDLSVRNNSLVEDKAEFVLFQAIQAPGTLWFGMYEGKYKLFKLSSITITAKQLTSS